MASLMANWTPRAMCPQHTLTAARGVSDSTEALTIETSVPYKSHVVGRPGRGVATTERELVSFFRDMSVVRHAEIAKLIRDAVAAFAELMGRRDGCSGVEG
uniref:Uncharacterized protein n=1 Tax=Oryza brachyantha TaxID=4533 RepID=J3NC96_ORYBR